MELVVEIDVASVSNLTVDCHGSHFVIQTKRRRAETALPYDDKEWEERRWR